MKNTTQPAATLTRSIASLGSLSAQTPAKSDGRHLRVRSSIKAGALSVVADANDPDISYLRLSAQTPRAL